MKTKAWMWEQLDVVYFKISRNILSLKPGAFYYKTYVISVRKEERNAPGGDSTI
jgi:hypothetical protein